MRSSLIKKRKHVLKINKRLFDKYRLWMLTSSVLGCSALIPATIDYEGSFVQTRTFENCEIHEYHNYAWRWLCLLLSLMAILAQFPYRYFRVKWEKHILHTFTAIPSYNQVTFYEVIKRIRSPRISDYVTFRAVGTAFVYLVLPYPYMSAHVYVPQGLIETSEDICYNLSEIFYAFMFCRLIILASHLFYFTKYQNLVAIRHCERFGVEPDQFFAFKCLMNERPLFMIGFCMFLPSIVFFTCVVRIFERPAQSATFSNPLVNWQNGLWCIFVSMTTVGDGVIYPVTLCGRVVVALAIIMGGVLLSQLFGVAGNFLLLADNQKYAYRSILISKAALNVIVAAIRYNKLARVGELGLSMRLWGDVLRQISVFKKIRDDETLGNDYQELEFPVLKQKLHDLEAKVDLVFQNLENFFQNSKSINQTFI